MTTSKNPYDLDAISCIKHAMELGIPIDKYITSMRKIALDKVRKVSDKLPEK